jgi:hypothetical protein
VPSDDLVIHRFSGFNETKVGVEPAGNRILGRIGERDICVSVLCEAIEKRDNSAATDATPLFRGINDEPSKPDRIIRIVDSPHEMADDRSVSFYSARVPFAAVMRQAQVASHRCDETFLVRPWGDIHCLTPIRGVYLHEPNLGRRAGHRVERIEHKGPVAGSFAWPWSQRYPDQLRPRRRAHKVPICAEWVSLSASFHS